MKARSHVLASAAAALFVAGVAGLALAAGDQAQRGEDQVRGREPVQGPGRVQERAQRLLRQERLQGQGLPDDDARRVQGREGGDEDEVASSRRGWAGARPTPPRIGAACRRTAPPARRAVPRLSASGCARCTTRTSSRARARGALGGRLVRGDQRELHGARRPPACACSARCARAAPLVLHGVSLNIGSSGSAGRRYLRRARRARARASSRAGSRITCAGRASAGANLHDLLPLPCTEESVAPRGRRGSRACRTRSGAASRSRTSPPTWPSAPTRCPSGSFSRRVARAADCGILLDVNNVFVSAHNHGFDAERYIDARAGRARVPDPPRRPQRERRRC